MQQFYISTGPEERIPSLRSAGQMPVIVGPTRAGEKELRFGPGKNCGSHWHSGPAQICLQHTGTVAQFHQLGARRKLKKLCHFAIDESFDQCKKRSSFLEFMPCAELVKLNQCWFPLLTRIRKTACLIVFMSDHQTFLAVYLMSDGMSSGASIMT